jgi:hypothetical protein
MTSCCHDLGVYQATVLRCKQARSDYRKLERLLHEQPLRDRGAAAELAYFCIERRCLAAAGRVMASLLHTAPPKI